MNEPELIHLLKQGNEPAFRWLVENYRNRVFSSVLNILQDTADAEDATQETFIQVFESIRTFKETSSLSIWIYRITIRKAMEKSEEEKQDNACIKYYPGGCRKRKKVKQLIFSILA